jgi:hypothetical protein
MEEIFSLEDIFAPRHHTMTAMTDDEWMTDD